MRRRKAQRLYDKAMRVANDPAATHGERGAALAKADRLKAKHLQPQQPSGRGGRRRQSSSRGGLTPAEQEMRAAHDRAHAARQRRLARYPEGKGYPGSGTDGIPDSCYGE